MRLKLFATLSLAAWLTLFLAGYGLGRLIQEIYG